MGVRVDDRLVPDRSCRRVMAVPMTRVPGIVGRRMAALIVPAMPRSSSTSETVPVRLDWPRIGDLAPHDAPHRLHLVGDAVRRGGGVGPVLVSDVAPSTKTWATLSWAISYTLR